MFSEIRCQEQHCSMFDILPFKYKHFNCCDRLLLKLPPLYTWNL